MELTNKEFPRTASVNANKPLGSVPPPGPNPTNILYMAVRYTITDGEISDTYSYDGTSGFYQLNPDIATFLNYLTTNGVPNAADKTGPITGSGTPPVPEVKDPCYVVFSIPFSNDAIFNTSDKTIKSSAAQASDYSALTSVTDSLTGQPAVHVVYFQAISPSHNGEVDVVDQFNLFLKVKQPNGDMAPKTFDPAIKNDGQTGLMSSRAKSKPLAAE